MPAFLFFLDNVRKSWPNQHRADKRQTDKQTEPCNFNLTDFWTQIIDIMDKVSIFEGIQIWQ